MLRIKFVYLMLFCSLIFLKSAAQTNVLQSNFEVLTISNQSIYVNSKTNNSIYEIIKLEDKFKKSHKNLINSGAFNPYTWIKLDVVNNSDKTDFIFEVNQTYIDTLQLFQVKNNTVIKEFSKKGLYFKQNNEPSFFKNKYAYIYSLKISKKDTIHLYLNGIVNDGSFKVLNKIWTKEKYQDRIKEVQYKTSYLIFFGGFVFLVLVLSIFMFVFSKTKMYLYYAGFVLITYVNILILRHFFSPLYLEKYGFFNNNAFEMIGLLQLAFMFQYFRYFFKLKINYKRLDKLFRYLSIATICYFVFALFLRNLDWFYAFSFFFTKFLTVFATFLVFGVAIYLVLKKHRIAIYFLIAYAPLFFLIAHFILSAFGLTNSYNPLEWEFVVFFEVFVLTIAMAHNYYTLTQENLANISKMYIQRIKISRDLHDNIGSQLTFIKSSIDNLKYISDSSNQKLVNKLEHISSFSSNTINQLRDTVWAMNKEDISIADLCDRVQSLIEKTKLVDSEIQFILTCKAFLEITFPSSIGIAIFRVIQEAVNNSLKYAKASEITIEIAEKGTNIQFNIKDNGIGFNIQDVELGNGLYNIQNRIKEIGGEVQINSKLNLGTEIIVIIKK